MQIERNFIEEDCYEGYYGRPRKPLRVALPTTPIPPRTSAYPENVVKIRPKYPRIYSEDEDITCISTLPEPTVWQYDSFEYRAESSLSALSLIPSEKACRAISVHIDELDTLSPARVCDEEEEFENEPDICERDTIPPILAHLLRILALHDAHRSSQQDAITEAETVQSPTISLAQIGELPIATDDSADVYYRATALRYGGWPWHEQDATFNPLERVRWWLLSPGRLEFLLWLSGTLFLMCLTGMLVFFCMSFWG